MADWSRLDNELQQDTLSVAVSDELMREVMSTTERLGHREHIHVTWLDARVGGVEPDLASFHWQVT